MASAFGPKQREIFLLRQIRYWSFLLSGIGLLLPIVIGIPVLVVVEIPNGTPPWDAALAGLGPLIGVKLTDAELRTDPGRVVAGALALLKFLFAGVLTGIIALSVQIKAKERELQREIGGGPSRVRRT